jgi:arylsulfatase A-like enzyme
MKEGVLISDTPSGTSHESPYPYDTHVPLAFWGADFKTGQFDTPVSTYDIAPTGAVILGLDFPPAPGSRILREALAVP